MKSALDFGPSLMPWPDHVRRFFPWALGAAAGFAATVSVSGVAVLSHAVRGKVAPKPAVVALGSGAVFASITVGAFLARKRFLGALFAESRSLDESCAVEPSSPLVSGSSSSAVPLSSHGREGARFIHAVTTDDDVRAVLGAGQLQVPIRVFIGYDAAPTIEGRVGLAMQELERTRAFERSHLLVLAPAGTGFANSTPVDACEILTQGDCATVVVSYGLLPSFLSLDRTEVGAETQRALLDAIVAHGYAGKLLLYGESLGAHVQQRALDVDDLSRFGIHRAMWVGTPGGGKASHPQAITVDHPDDISHEDADIWLLEHHGDPVVRMSTDVIFTRPAWLAEDQRGRNVPVDMRWSPFITFSQIFVDTLYATDVRPGDFQSFGHDYRADLAAVTSAAYGFGVDPDQISRLDDRLRLLEKQRADRINRNP
jgi:uncharacterized membrane protein